MEPPSTASSKPGSDVESGLNPADSMPAAHHSESHEQGHFESPVAAALFSCEPESVDPRYITVDRIASWILSGFLIAGGLAVTIIVWINRWPPNWIGWLVFGGWAALTIVLVWTAHVWPVIWYRHLKYTVTERGVEIQRGVLWRKVISLPQARVQHTDVVQGPLQRKYGIATLVTHTAGTKNSTVSLEGVSRERAMQIRDFLLQGGLDDAV